MGRYDRKLPSSSYNRIIDAFSLLIQQKRYPDITIRDICNAANVSSGSFYHFFNNKNDVMRERNKSKNQEIANRMIECTKDQNTFNQIINYTKCYAQNNIDAGVELLKSLLSPNGTWYIERQPMILVLEDVIQQGQENGTLITTMPYLEILDYFVDVLRGVSYIWCMKNGDFDLEDRLIKHIRILLHAFLKVV